MNYKFLPHAAELVPNVKKRELMVKCVVAKVTDQTSAFVNRFLILYDEKAEYLYACGVNGKMMLLTRKDVQNRPTFIVILDEFDANHPSEHPTPDELNNESD